MPRKLILALGLFTCLATGLSAQAPNAESPTCNEEFARFLVDQQVSESRSVEQTDKRVRILIRAAEFIWKFDEPMARSYFTEAFKVAYDRFREKGFERTEKKGLIKWEPDYRFDVIRAVGQKDGEWAKKLIDQVLKEYEKDSDRKELEKDREINEVLRVARESVVANPELSRALFRRAMQYPLDYYWFWALFGVAEKNVQFADTLYRDLLTNYSNAAPRRLLFLSAYPFARERIFGPDKFGYGTTVPPSLTRNPALEQRFIVTYLQRAISFANDPENLNRSGENYNLPEPAYLVGALAELEPIVVQQFPTLFPQFSEAKARAHAMLSEQARKELDQKEKRNGSLGSSFEERLKELEKADAEGRLDDGMIISLLTWGDNLKTDQQFKQIEPWLDKISEEEARNEAVNYFWFMRAQRAVKDLRLEAAEQYAKKIPEIEHRAILSFQIAEAQLKNVNDASTVYQTLRDVGRLAEQSETSVEKARVLIALANEYLSVNPIFAMQELNDAVKVINRLENADVMSTSVMRRIQTKNYSFFAGFALPGQNLEGTFKAISKDNFELSLSAAKALEDKYLRTLAVLAVAQNCVEKNKKAGPPKKPAAGSRKN